MTGTERELSLAAWSFHGAYAGGAVDACGMLEIAAGLGFRAFEPVTLLLSREVSRAGPRGALAELDAAAGRLGLAIDCVMCEGEGDLADVLPWRRVRSSKAHRTWLEACVAAGCPVLRVQLRGGRRLPRITKAIAIRSLRQLVRAARGRVVVAVENHPGLLGRPEVLRHLLDAVPGLRLLLDVGNFDAGVELVPAMQSLLDRTVAVSAKFRETDIGQTGDGAPIDYPQVARLLVGRGFTGWVGVEWEGVSVPEHEGVTQAIAILRAAFRDAAGA